MSENKSSFEKRRKVEHQQHAPQMHHDESNWLVSYADMMTLLFGFFVLIYSMSKVDTEKFVVVSKDIAKYFGGRANLPSVIPEVEQKVKEALAKAGITDDKVLVTSTPMGMKLRFNSAILFDPGSARLKEEMYPVLTRVVETLRNTQQIEEIRVEGHTDDSPIQSPYFPTNWELSAARASRILRQFEAGGIPSQQLIAEGFGASRPEKPNSDAQGLPIKENQIANRRVMINVAFKINAEKGQLEKLSEFKRIEESVPKSEEALRTEEQALDNEEVLKQKLIMAKEKLEEANKKLAETEALAKKKQQLKDLENKIKQTEEKTSEAQKKIYEIQKGK